ncbi:membrane protein FxsA [candidate division KSB1 bacterium]|jgi:UPF0716 protein FxsA|nr:membrane protein FxsA [candidate division KSB1 bacterium]
MVFMLFVVLFIGLPLLELAILIKLGQWMGLMSTIMLVILTGMVGAALARFQGFLVIRRIQSELQQSRMPAEQLLDGLLILIGGVVLLTPGLLTDIFGLCLLLPFTRTLFKRGLRKWFDRMIQRGETRIYINF